MKKSSEAEIADSFKNKTLKSIVAYLTIMRNESVTGKYTMEGGEEAEGSAVNKTKVSGEVAFKEDGDHDFSQLVEFLSGCWDEIEEFDSFEGHGVSTEYEMEDFENFEEGDSAGCDYEGCAGGEISPTKITLFFDDGDAVEFDAESTESYSCKIKHKTHSLTKEDLASVIGSLSGKKQ